MTVYGASGGYGTNALSSPGQGGISYSDIRLKAGQKLYVYVGGQGGRSRGGWNGGGVVTAGYHVEGGGGGGATDIRLLNGAWNNAASLKSRILVAGGGGGTNQPCNTACNGGAGGGLNGASVSNPKGAVYSGYGGTQTSGGGHGGHEYNRTAGFGYGVGAYTCGGGGGGGWYGGSSGYGTSGAGGSSYILDYPGCYTGYSSYQHSLASVTMGTKIGSGYTWGMQQGGRNGDGFARIVLTTVE